MNDRIQDNTVRALRAYLDERLAVVYPEERERTQVVRSLFSHHFGWSSAELISRATDRLSESEVLKLHFSLKKLVAGVPLQYVTGKAWFYGTEYHVAPGVLIPRPETEELVDHILRSGSQPQRILDIGTGSGCIAIALAQHLPTARVTAIDSSQEALAIARTNAARIGVEVHFQQWDILSGLPPGEFDLIVSNPPYITLSEAATMHTRVTEHEPHGALFVPDGDPLLFYRAIAQGVHAQGKATQLWFECHETYAQQVGELLDAFGWNVQVIRDMQGKERIAIAGVPGH